MLALLSFTSFVKSSGYEAIFILSVLQSCCIPTSSELTLGFAGYEAYQHHLSLPGVILVGAAGEVVGAYIAWVVGRYAGRGFVDRYGKYILLTHHDLDRAERWFHRHERWGVFGSRLVPVIRNFVAVPAGVAEVPLVRFGILTALGSLVWDGAMALIGYEVGGSYTRVMKGFSEAGYVIAAVAVAVIAFVLWHRWRSYRRYSASSGPAGLPHRDRHLPRPARSAGPSPRGAGGRPRDGRNGGRRPSPSSGLPSAADPGADHDPEL